KKLWDVDRIKEEKALKNEYGLANMSELWRAASELKKYRREARRLLSLTEEERRDDAEKILHKLARLGILKEGAVLDDVLSLDAKAVLERRLQTLVVRKGLARTTSQARQLITHGFIAVNGHKISRPGVMVLLENENAISYARPIDISVPEEEAEPAKEEKAPEKPAKAEEKQEKKPEEKPKAEPAEKEAKEAPKAEEPKKEQEKKAEKKPEPKKEKPAAEKTEKKPEAA
ncbi:MAG: hypothetical protein AMK69_24925, partial [Nitrospira bacterium SG8_3]